MSEQDKSGGTQAIRVPSQNQRFQLEAIELQVISGSDSGFKRSYSLPVLRIGTASDNDVILTDPTVSRHHAEIHMTAEGLLLRELGSTNGTFIGSLRVGETYLGADTECKLGYTRIAIRPHTEEHQVEIPSEDHLGQLVGASGPMRELYGYIRAVAPTPTTVLIQGESGSGKELVARTLHELSGREGPLVVFDASVTDPEMVRNDLFGHVKGAFTGAAGSREGAFRRADKGTLFIDEIGELPLDLQPRLLRALENREVTPIGSDRPTRVDVRVVAATHRNLQAMVSAGVFRADLFFRLSVMPLRVPPMREIREDIPLLVRSFVEQLQLNCRVTSEALMAMQNYQWPGNVRELRNVLERAAVLCRHREIRAHDLHLTGSVVPPSAFPGSHPLTAPVSPLPPSATQPTLSTRDQLREQERQMILDTMTRNGNNKTAAARELGIPLSTLKRRLKEYDM
jgi:transcriptional regulator with GAF, ATPase, and Fis domain